MCHGICQNMCRDSNDQKKRKMETFKEQLFSCKSGGYIVIPRQLALHLLRQLKENGPTELYAYMLVNANFATTGQKGGTTIQRGELDMSIEELLKTYNGSRSTLYRTLLELETNEVIIKKKRGNRVFFVLPKYEQHCGRQVRPEERKPIPQTPEESNTEKSFEEFFGYYHFVMHLPSKDKEQARREWKHLSLDEREEALQNVIPYRDASQGQRYRKQAYNYLKDKSFKM